MSDFDGPWLSDREIEAKNIALVVAYIKAEESYASYSRREGESYYLSAPERSSALVALGKARSACSDAGMEADYCPDMRILDLDGVESPRGNWIA